MKSAFNKLFSGHWSFARQISEQENTYSSTKESFMFYNATFEGAEKAPPKCSGFFLVMKNVVYQSDMVQGFMLDINIMGNSN